jgi:hypothetical protein
MNARHSALIIILCFVLSTFALAQKNEVSFSVGALHSSDQTESVTFPGFPPTFPALNTSTNTGVAFEGNYARQLFNFRAGSLDVEFPLVGAPSRDVALNTLGVNLPGALSTTALFFTPSVRIKLLHSSPISPFFSVGGGLAHFGSTFNIVTPAIFPGVPTLPSSSVSSSTNHGVLQFGGGLDFKTPLPHLALRAEVRDFWAVGVIQPGTFVQVSPERQHNIFASGGVVFKF